MKDMYYGMLESMKDGSGEWFTLCDNEDEAVSLSEHTWNRLLEAEKERTNIVAVKFTHEEMLKELKDGLLEDDMFETMDNGDIVYIGSECAYNFDVVKVMYDMDKMTKDVYNGEYDNLTVDVDTLNEILDHENCKNWECLGQSGKDSSLMWFDVLYQAENEESYGFDVYVNKEEYYENI